MAKTVPEKLLIRTFNVGFGDCFLLTFVYPRMERHVLIDFGYTGKAVRNKSSATRIAKEIGKLCKGKLHAVVATHRHRDHISGFRINGKGTGPGDIIRSLNPEVVIQPWTEHPDAQPGAKQAPSLRGLGLNKRDLAHIQNLAHMNAVANSAFHFVKGRRFGLQDKKSAKQLEFLGDNNIKNRRAVEGLLKMATPKNQRYVHFGSNAGLGRILPGVKTHVLGPPTLSQSDKIRQQRAVDLDEFWHLRARVGQRSLQNGKILFAPHFVQRTVPIAGRWFKMRLHHQQVEATLQIVRMLDDAMNNTSVILLFECQGKSLLFPGDAQIENWQHALNHKQIKKRLQQVDVYKVGHHGSLNATPKSLWEEFKKGPARKQEPPLLHALLSTKSDFHGDVNNKTEVPRQTLLDALKGNTILVNTENETDFPHGAMHHSLEISFSRKKKGA